LRVFVDTEDEAISPSLYWEKLWAIYQICPGSSGSGSLTGTSGFSGGSTGSWIGEGYGSAGVRIWRSDRRSWSRGMPFRCWRSYQRQPSISGRGCIRRMP